MNNVQFPDNVSPCVSSRDHGLICLELPEICCRRRGSCFSIIKLLCPCRHVHLLSTGWFGSTFPKVLVVEEIRNKNATGKLPLYWVFAVVMGTCHSHL